MVTQFFVRKHTVKFKITLSYIRRVILDVIETNDCYKINSIAIKLENIDFISSIFTFFILEIYHNVSFLILGFLMEIQITNTK